MHFAYMTDLFKLVI